MAYQTRRRDPLFDSKTQAALERRGSELLGLALLAAGIAVALTMGTYSPDDPSWLAATDEPVRNFFGRFGASIASPLIVIAGLGGWGVAAILVVWGVRLTLHSGVAAIGRLVFAPIAVALVSVYAATHAPGPGWDHSFGLGGLFGDTVLGALLGMLPMPPATGLRVAALGIAAAGVTAMLYVMGVTIGELRAFAAFCIRSSRRALIALLGLTLRGAASTIDGAAAARQRMAARQQRGEARSKRGESIPERGVRSVLARFPSIPLPFRRAVAAGPAEATRPARLAREAAPNRNEPPVVRREPLLDDDELPAPELVAPEPSQIPRFGPVRRPVQDAVAVVQHSKARQRPSARARAEAEPSLPLEEAAAAYEPPPLGLLANPADIVRHHLSDEALEENARMLESVLDDYGVKGEIVSVRPGPVVTMYELEPAPGLKASRVIGLADDIARSMSALSARVSTVPGRSVIGIELPNANREKVVLREILSARDYGDGTAALPLALGKDIGGEPVVANLARMPHLLIAGTTGSGKSVAINTMILSLLYKLSPDECRLIMIDPKMLELSVYDGIPHLLSPVVTDPKKAVVALKWVVAEMEERYRKMSKMGVRNIDGYNGRVAEALAKGEMFSRTVQTGFDDETGDPVFETEEFAPEAMPFIVVIVDEMADLMMVAGKEIEACIQRLAQMARASGIHLIMATQRPSVDVITGTIKANFPTRISFQVTSKIDSRTILGEQGAEQLLGMGDMLYMAGGSRITRVHGPFCSDEEVEEVVRHLKSLGPPEYETSVLDGPDEGSEADIDAVLGLGGNTDGEDALYDQAVAIVAKDRKCSTSYIQRKLAIGYNKAARLVEQMEENGLVSQANHVGKREILVPETQ